MFIVVSYDISSERSRSRARIICGKYLQHIQKSVFEGEISEKKLCVLKEKLKAVVDPEADSAVICRFDLPGVPQRERIGRIRADEDEFI